MRSASANHREKERKLTGERELIRGERKYGERERGQVRESQQEKERERKGAVVHLLPLLPLLPLLRWEMAGYGSWSEGEEKKRRK